MIIKFERRTDQPDAAGRCKVYLVATFDGQRLRISTGERCLASEWNEEKSRFRKSLSGSQEANNVLAAADLPPPRLRRVLHDIFWKSVNTQPDGTELK